MYVCLCKGITDSQIKDAVRSGAESLRAVREQLGVGTGCGKCASFAREIVCESLSNQDSDACTYYEVVA